MPSLTRLLNQLGQTLEGVVIAFEAIRANRVRAALTIGGVAIGVFVVVAMSAAVHGVTASFQQDVDALGATTFQVRVPRSGDGNRSCVFSLSSASSWIEVARCCCLSGAEFQEILRFLFVRTDWLRCKKPLSTLRVARSR